MDELRREASNAHCVPLGTRSQGQCFYYEIARPGFVFYLISEVCLLSGKINK